MKFILSLLFLLSFSVSTEDFEITEFQVKNFFREMYFVTNEADTQRTLNKIVSHALKKGQIVPNFMDANAIEIV